MSSNRAGIWCQPVQWRENDMKVKTLIQQMYEAISRKDIAKQKELYLKITKKSLKHKKTHAVQ